MNRQKFVNGFHLDNEGVFDQKINDIPLCDLDPFVFEREGHLAVIGDASKLQLAAQASVIAGFQETRAKVTMNLDPRSDNFFTDQIGGVLDESHDPSRKSGTWESLVGESSSLRRVRGSSDARGWGHHGNKDNMALRVIP
jgi:hypothetical protein